MKNAYEIRLEVLRMAHDDLFFVYQEMVANSRAVDGTYSNPDIIKNMLPTADSIKDRAEDLYAFVTEK
jgi:hypothetical protein